MEYQKAVGLLFVLLMIFAAVASTGCTSSTVHRPGWIIPNPTNFSPNLIVGISFTFKVFVSVNISGVKTSQDYPNILGLGATNKYREFTVTCGLSASWTPDTAQSAVVPVTSVPVTDGSLATYQVWSDSVKNWFGSTYNQDGTIQETDNGTDPTTPGTGDQLIEKPSRYFTFVGQSFEIDSTLQAAYNQIQTEFSFDVYQGGNRITNFSKPLFANLPTSIDVATVPTVEYTFQFYLPFGGRFSKAGFNIQTFEHKQTFLIGWAQKYWVDPTTNLAAHFINWAGDITGYWGHNFGDFLLEHAYMRLDYSVIPYFESTGPLGTVADKSLDLVF